MKKALIPLLAVPAIIALLANVSYASTWARTYAGSYPSYATSIKETSDGSYVVAGYICYDIDPLPGFMGRSILKLDGNGIILWSKRYPGYYYIRGIGGNLLDIQPTIDGGFIVGDISEIAIYGPTSGDSNVLRLDSSGEIEWRKSYGNETRSIRQTIDGGVILLEFYSYNIDYQNVFVTYSQLIKLNDNGTVQWFSGWWDRDIFTFEEPKDIVQTSDGGYGVVGKTSVSGTTSNYIWVARFDSSGTFQWQKSYLTGSGYNEPRSILQTSDGGYIVGGNTFLVKLDAQGDIEWQKTYGGSNANFIQKTSDGGYILSGWTTSFGAGGSDMWLLKLDDNGTIQWERTYGGSGEEKAFSAQETSDGGYIIAGFTSSAYPDDVNMLILKVDSNGDIPDCDIVGTSNTSVAEYGLVAQNMSVMDIGSVTVTTDGQVQVDALALTSEAICNDSDNDGVTDDEDTCTSTPNGPAYGTCVKSVGGVLIGTGVTCTDNATCAPYGVCQMAQEDMNANRIGDACECYADANHDGKVNTTDLGIMKTEFFRTNCATVPCQADLNGDGKVNTSDLGIMKVQFFKTGCPVP